MVRATQPTTKTLIFILDQPPHPVLLDASPRKVFHPSTSIRSDGKFIHPVVLNLKSNVTSDFNERKQFQLLPINTNNPTAMKELLESWVRMTCQALAQPAVTCVTYGWSVETIARIQTLPCVLFEDASCPLNHCGLFGARGCQERTLCEIFNTRQSCRGTGHCKWTPESVPKCLPKH
jgi:hypothetical protein